MSAVNHNRFATNKKTPILFLINNLDRAGAERVFVNQANYLTALGYQVYFATLIPERYDNFVTELKVPLERRRCLNYQGGSSRLAREQLVQLIDRYQIKTVYATLELPKIIARLLKWRRPHLRVVIRESGAMLDSKGRVRLKSWKFKFLDMILNFWADQVIVLTEEMRQLSGSYQPWHAHKLVVLGNGVTIVDHEQEIIQRNKYKKQEPVWTVIAVASMNYYERAFEYLIEALTLLPVTLKKRWRLVLVGDGTLRSWYEEKVAGWSLVDQVTFTGRVETEFLRNLYRKSHTLAMVSTAEGFPNVILEAGAFGLPIISTPVGGATEAVREGKTGFFVPPKDSAAIAAKLAWFIENPDTWEQIALQSYHLTHDHFSLDMVMRKLIKILVLD